MLHPRTRYHVLDAPQGALHFFQVVRTTAENLPFLILELAHPLQLASILAPEMETWSRFGWSWCLSPQHWAVRWLQILAGWDKLVKSATT